MHFEFLVEEQSAEKVLNNLLPKIVTCEHNFTIITFKGKHDMLKRLPLELKGYSRFIKPSYKIVILIDRDSADCKELKQKLEKFASDAGINTKSVVPKGKQFYVLNRIAIEELEAWFFGDAEAIRTAYPRVSSSFENRAQYRNPDSIAGGTWEALERVDR